MPLTLRSVVAHVAGSFYGVLYTIYLIQDLHLNPFLLGIVVSAGGVGSLVGSFVAARVIARLGFGPALIWTATGASIVGVLTPLAGGPLLLATLMVFIPQLVGDGLQTVEEIAELSLIQGVIPDRILGRVNATLEVFSHGVAYPLGALMAAGVARLDRRPRRRSPSAGPGWRSRSCSSSSRRCRGSGSARTCRRSRTNLRAAPCRGTPRR